MILVISDVLVNGNEPRPVQQQAESHRELSNIQFASTEAACIVKALKERGNDSAFRLIFDIQW